MSVIKRWFARDPDGTMWAFHEKPVEIADGRFDGNGVSRVLDERFLYEMKPGECVEVELSIIRPVTAEFPLEWNEQRDRFGNARWQAFTGDDSYDCVVYQLLQNNAVSWKIDATNYLGECERMPWPSADAAKSAVQAEHDRIMRERVTKGGS